MTWSGPQTDLPPAHSPYGSLAGVQEILRPVLATISNATAVTDADVASELASLSLVFDARLAPAGYVLPITAPDALGLLDRASNLAAASTMLERLMMSAAPTDGRVSVASIWRKESRAILDGACSGVAPLPGAAMQPASGGGTALPSVASRESVLPADDFASRYGAH